MCVQYEPSKIFAKQNSFPLGVKSSFTRCISAIRDIVLLRKETSSCCARRVRIESLAIACAPGAAAAADPLLRVDGAALVLRNVSAEGCGRTSMPAHASAHARTQWGGPTCGIVDMHVMFILLHISRRVSEAAGAPA